MRFFKIFLCVGAENICYLCSVEKIFMMFLNDVYISFLACIEKIHVTNEAAFSLSQYVDKQQ